MVAILWPIRIPCRRGQVGDAAHQSFIDVHVRSSRGCWHGRASPETPGRARAADPARY